jgi:alpha-tubulin suppressor-like RCC1 family protein
MVLMPDGSVRDFPSQPSWTTPKLTNAVAIASDGINRFALLSDGRLIAWGHKRFYPNGMVTLATLGPETARQCAARPR